MSTRLAQQQVSKLDEDPSFSETRKTLDNGNNFLFSICKFYEPDLNFMNKRVIMTLTLWLWEGLVLPYTINQTIIHFIMKPLKLVFLLTLITMFIPHLFLIIIHSVKTVDGEDIPKIPTNKTVLRRLKMSRLIFWNIFFEFAVHILVYLYVSKYYLLETDKDLLGSDHLIKDYFYDFFIPLIGIELVYDFIYYWWHYYGHKNRFLWNWVHAKHHEIEYPRYLDVYHMNYVETWFLRMSVFLLHGLFGIFRFRLGTMVMIQHFILFIEFIRHSGLSVSDSDVSLSRHILSKFNVTIDAIHHDYHHQAQCANYSKRIGIWDKVFATFYDPQKALDEYMNDQLC